MAGPENETRTQISELIAAGVADPATLVLLRAMQEILLKLDAIEAKVSQFETVLDWNDQNIMQSMDYRMVDLLKHYGRRR